MKVFKLIYFAGWLSFDKMQNEPNWLTIWKKAAARAKNENKTLIVFEVPEATSTETIEYIEKYLQDKNPIQ